MTDPAPSSDAPRSRAALWAVLPIAVAAVFLLVLLATRPSASEREDHSELIGQLAPIIEGPTIDGGWFDIDDHRGRWVVVNFFSTTCVPCIREHPELVAFQEFHEPLGDATIVSVTFDDQASNVVEFFEENGGEWPVLVEDTGSIAVQYGVTGVPESFLVSPTGVVAERITGQITAAFLQDRLIANAQAGATDA